MTSQYNRRGAIDLKPDDHEFWRLVQKRVAQKWSWEQIAAEIGCEVGELINWANWVYQPPKLPKVSSTQSWARTEHQRLKDLPEAAPIRQTRQFMAWKRARDGARAAREAMKA